MEIALAATQTPQKAKLHAGQHQHRMVEHHGMVSGRGRTGDLSIMMQLVLIVEKIQAESMQVTNLLTSVWCKVHTRVYMHVSFVHISADEKIRSRCQRAADIAEALS